MSDSNNEEEEALERKVEKRRRRRRKNRADKASDGGGSSSEDEEAKKKRRRARRRKQKLESKKDDEDDEDNNNNSEQGEEDSNKRRRRKKRRNKSKTNNDDEEEGGEEEEEEGNNDDEDNKQKGLKKKRSRSKKKKKKSADDEEEEVEEGDNIARLRTKVMEIQRREFDPAQYNFEIDEEDLMDGPLLPFEGRSHYIRLNVPPPETTITGTQDYALTREQQSKQKVDGSGKPTFVYVESATTGRFRRVRMGRLGYRQLGMSDNDDVDQNASGPEVMTHFTDNVNAFTATVYGFAQGLLAGFALLHVYIANMFEDRSRFLEVYWPLAGESRRLFFFLTTIALTSAYDLYLRESSKRDLWQVLPAAKKIRVYLILILYFVALLSSLLAMPIDNSIAKLGWKGMYSTPLLSDAAITQWNVYEWIRSVACVMAWVLVCFGIHEENQNGRRFMAHCKYLNTEIAKKQRRLDNVSGKQLQYATPDELEDFLKIQRSAAEATERAIEYYRKRSVNR